LICQEKQAESHHEEDDGKRESVRSPSHDGSMGCGRLERRSGSREGDEEIIF